jgi:hypothetical protein
MGRSNWFKWFPPCDREAGRLEAGRPLPMEGTLGAVDFGDASGMFRVGGERMNEI